MVHAPEEYFAYSVKVLSNLYAADSNPDLLLNNGAVHMQLPPLPPPKKSRNKQPPPMSSLPRQVTNLNNSDMSNNAVKMALDQFPMASPSISRNNKVKQIAVSDSRNQYSDMSMASLSTISDIHTITSGLSSKESIPKGLRGSFDSLVTSLSHQKICDKEKHHYDLDKKQSLNEPLNHHQHL